MLTRGTKRSRSDDGSRFDDGSRSTTLLVRETAKEATWDVLRDVFGDGDGEKIAGRGADARGGRSDRDSGAMRSPRDDVDDASSTESRGFVRRHPGVAGVVVALGIGMATVLVRRRRSSRDDVYGDASDDRGKAATVPIEDDGGGSGAFVDDATAESSSNETSDDVGESRTSDEEFGTSDDGMGASDDEFGTTDADYGAGTATDDESGTGTDEE